MSNHYFQFKQFRVEQDKCAMKVSTDACILGVWTPMGKDVKRVLDLGAGTGILSLMLAQRNKEIVIDAIELDANAAQQAKENVSQSPWSERINVMQGDARNHTFQNRYDLIICNPPFFRNSLLGNDENRNNARHTLTLSYEDVLKIFENALSEDGYISILLPVAEHEIWKGLLENKGWFINKLLFVQPKDSMKVNRVVSLCSRKTDNIAEEMLTIYTVENRYTPEAVQLLSPFYLNL